MTTFTHWVTSVRDSDIDWKLPEEDFKKHLSEHIEGAADDLRHIMMEHYKEQHNGV